MSANLKELSRRRLREARLLLRNGEYSGAYYLAGYAVECGLKACVTGHFRPYEVPQKQLIVDLHTHNLHKLVLLAGLDNILGQEKENDPAFQSNWDNVESWSEAARYELWSARDAQGMVDAVADRRHGVLRWVRQYWRTGT